MATSAGEVEVTLTLNAAKFQQMMGQTQQQLGGFSSAIDQLGQRLAAVLSFAAISSFFSKSLDAYGQQTLATAKLSQSLLNQGLAVESNVEHLNEFAEALQRTTGVSVTTVMEAQALMTTFGLQGAVLDRTTKAAVNMSAVLGIDLVTSSKLLGKAFDGNYGMLARYGIIIDKTIPQSEQFNSILMQLEKRFGGTAVAMAASYGGQIKILGSSFDELEKAVGKLLVTGGSGGALGWLIRFTQMETDSLTVINHATESMHGFGNMLRAVGIELLRVVIDSITRILDVTLAVLSKFPLMNSGMTALRTQVDTLNKSLNTELDHWQATSQAAITASAKKVAAVKAVSGAHSDYIMTAQAAETAMAKWQEDRTLMDQKEFQDSLKVKESGYEKFASAFALTTDNMWLAAGKSAKQVSDAFAKGMAEVIVQGHNFHDTMIAIWQDIEMQVIEYIIKLITKELILLALETATGTVGGGGGGGIAAAPSFFDGMFAEGGVIEEPSIITGLRSGSKILAGESGPEMVTPMNGTGAGAGAGAITINISGQFLEADQNTWGRLVREQIIPQIRRATMANPTGPFNRTRGVV